MRACKFFIYLTVLLLNVNSVKAGGGGGACTFSGSYTAPTSVALCTPTAADNTACVIPSCNCRHSCPSAGCADQSGGACAWFDGSSNICQTAADFYGCKAGTGWTQSGYCGADISLMAAIVNCDNIQYPLPGSMENVSFTQICVPAALLGGPCNFTFSINGITCSGGGGDLQYAFYKTAPPPATALAAYAGGVFSESGAIKNNVSTTAALTSGSCYRQVFDGNCNAACQFTYQVSPAFTPTVTASNTTVCANACASIAFTATCYTSISWSSSDGQSGTTTSSPLTFCPCNTGAITLTLTPTAALGGACATITGTAQSITITSNPPTISGITFNPASPLAGCQTQVSATVTCGSALTYLWSDGKTTSTNCDGTSAGGVTKTVTLTSTATDASANCSKTYTTTASASVTWSANTACSNCAGGSCNCTIILPIELVSFKGEPTPANTVNLTWKTASEQDNDYFAVEHALNGNDFTEIGRIKGKGDSKEENEYSFVHQNPVHGMNYYRLKQVDFNKKFSYSHIIGVELRIPGAFQFTDVHPIPATDKVFISYFLDEDNQLTLEVYNIEGKKIKEESFLSRQGDYTQTLDIAGYSSGIYFVFLKKKNNQTIISKFVKE